MTSPDTTVDAMLEILVSEGVTHIQVSGYIIFVDSFEWGIQHCMVLLFTSKQSMQAKRKMRA